MHIEFKKVNIQNFQAIKSAEIEFNNQGIVLVRGTNNYEGNAESNGSGKSSCFESVIWAIYGNTSAGISNPKNRYSDGICSVTLDFNIDTSEYSITRTIKDSTKEVELKCNGEDISSRNKSDTDKAIKELFPFGVDIFLSTIFLSQGFNSRISTLSPSGRKERIETLTGIADKVEDFKSKISKIKSSLDKEGSECSNTISFKEGSKASATSSMNNLINRLEEILEENKENEDIDVDEIRAKISSYKEKYEEITNMRSEVYDEYSSKCNIRNLKESSINNIESKIRKLREDITKLHSNICPTCETVLNQEVVDKIKKEYEEEILENKKILTQDMAEYEEASLVIKELEPKIKIYDTKIKETKASISELDLLLSKVKSNDATSEIKESIKELKTKIFDLDKEINELNTSLTGIKNKQDIILQCSSLVSKQFRTYLLENIIEFMNSKLKQYSDMLFSNPSDRIMLNSNSNKLDINLGDSSYESLSGGEKRKVDIALTFAQRDLLLDIVGVSTNLIILDEVMDHMDQTATSIALEMITNIADSISSMFIISHNNYEIPFDRIIQVSKDINRCSKIEIV